MNDLLYVTEKHKVILNYLSANELKNKKILDVGSSYNNRIENEMRPNGTSSKTLEDLSKH